jgi:hypothetical protein
LIVPSNDGSGAVRSHNLGMVPRPETRVSAGDLNGVLYIADFLTPAQFNRFGQPVYTLRTITGVGTPMMMRTSGFASVRPLRPQKA